MTALLAPEARRDLLLPVDSCVLFRAANGASAVD
jgi:hypothetical protein